MAGTPQGGFRLKLTPRASEQRELVRKTNAKRFKKINKALSLLKTDPKYPGLQAHKWSVLKGKAPDGGDMWTAYVENNTPSAWRIFYFFDSRDPGLIYVTSIEPHT